MAPCPTFSSVDQIKEVADHHQATQGETVESAESVTIDDNLQSVGVDEEAGEM